MGKFCKAVQRGDVASPGLRRFTPEAWDADYARLGEDEGDRSLHKVGHLVFAKANTIRSSLKISNSNKWNATTKLRAFVAITNHALWVLAHKTKEALAKTAADKERVLTTDLASIKIGLAIGAEFSPDEIIQSMVDGAQLGIQEVLRSNPPLSGNPRLGEMDWQEAFMELNLGNLYEHLQDVWDDCLWNDYRLYETPACNLLIPVDPDWLRIRAASRARKDNLDVEFLVNAQNVCLRMPPAKLHRLIGVRDVKAITKIGRKQLIQLSTSTVPTEESIRMFAARAHAIESYYSELLTQPRQKLGGAGLSEVLRARSVVASIAERMLENLGGDALAEEAGPESWLPSFAPVIQRDALRRAVVEAAGLDYRQAGAVIEFLTFRGEKGQELWAQSLIPVSDTSLAPMVAAARYPSLSRLIDVWLEQLDVDLGLRGPAFEGHVRTELAGHIESSKLRGNASVLPTALKLRPPVDREEEIDVVLVIGSLVIIGEVKCALQPTGPKRYAMHRKTVVDAVAQVKRKARSVELHRGLFRADLSRAGIAVSDTFEILPVVILNGAIHAGVPYEGVPIVDMHMFSVFFSGELVELAQRNSAGATEVLKKRVLYHDAGDAGKRAVDYFQAPPQMGPFVAGVQERLVPIASVCDSDWSGEYLTFGCTPVAPLSDS